MAVGEGTLMRSATWREGCAGHNKHPEGKKDRTRWPVHTVIHALQASIHDLFLFRLISMALNEAREPFFLVESS